LGEKKKLDGQWCFVRGEIVNGEKDIIGFMHTNMMKNTRSLDFRLLDNFNWIFIGILWLVLFLQWNLIGFWHAVAPLQALI